MTVPQTHLAFALETLVAHAYFPGGMPEGPRAVLSELVSAMESGDVCSRPQDGRAVDELRRAGAASPAGPGAQTPLVIDARGRLYLNRFYGYERLIAERVAQLSRERMLAEPAVLKAALAATQLPFEEDGKANEQAVAVATAMLNPVSVVSGGPGTGKTYTIAQIVRAFLALDPGMRIGLAAPTGKAASRLTQGLAAKARDFGLEGFPTQARTIHSLMRAMRSETFDAIIVDEAGMVGLELMGRLFRFAKDASRFVLVGDKDQLTSVDEGAVFAEMSLSCGFDAARREALANLGFAPGALPESTSRARLAASTTWITKTRRFEASGAIARLASAVLAGQADEALEVLASDSGEVAGRFFNGQAAYRRALLQEVVARFTPYRDLVAEIVSSARPLDEACARRLFEEVARNGVLVGTNEGACGASSVNAHVREALFQDMPGAGERFAGEILIVTRNDYANALYNGDVGIVVPTAVGLKALFAETRQGKTGYRLVSLLKLADFKRAFAITVHKSQGSEFENVLLALPEKSRLLTREYFYTGITRAKRTLTVYGSEESVVTAIATRQERTGGFLDRLEEAFGD